MKISYGVLTHNEGSYVSNLLQLLTQYKRPEDEIVVVDDYSDDQVTLNSLEQYSQHISLYRRVFDGDATQKNYLNSLCKGDYILQLDADELMLPKFLQTLPQLLELNPSVDLFLIPRINTVEGLTNDLVAKWKWRVNEKGWVNFPDYQPRLYANREPIKWKGLLHSTIEGASVVAPLPEQEFYSIIHAKKVDRQIAQNDLYDRIEKNGRTVYKV